MSKQKAYEMSEEAAMTLEEEREERFEKARGRLRFTTIVLLVALIIPLSIYGIDGGQGVVLKPDYALVPEEENAKPSNDNMTKLEASENGGAVALIYSDEIEYSLDTDILHLSFTNPSSSTAAVILQIMITNGSGEEFLLAESGSLAPGYSVETLGSDKAPDVTLAQGVYTGIMRVLFYNPDTGERAIVNSDIAVHITVQ